MLELARLPATLLHEADPTSERIGFVDVHKVGTELLRELRLANDRLMKLQELCL